MYAVDDLWSPWYDTNTAVCRRAGRRRRTSLLERNVHLQTAIFAEPRGDAVDVGEGRQRVLLQSFRFLARPAGAVGSTSLSADHQLLVVRYLYKI